jgi:hypothetical protein
MDLSVLEKVLLQNRTRTQTRARQWESAVKKQDGERPPADLEHLPEELDVAPTYSPSVGNPTTSRETGVYCQSDVNRGSPQQSSGHCHWNREVGEGSSDSAVRSCLRGPFHAGCDDCREAKREIALRFCEIAEHQLFDGDKPTAFDYAFQRIRHLEKRQASVEKVLGLRWDDKSQEHVLRHSPLPGALAHHIPGMYPQPGVPNVAAPPPAWGMSTPYPAQFPAGYQFASYSQVHAAPPQQATEPNLGSQPVSQYPEDLFQDADTA